MIEKKVRKYPFITILIASLFMVLQRVLTSATVIPSFSGNPDRFYLYQTIYCIFFIGLNLIPLYFGYYQKKIRKTSLVHRLSRYLLLYIVMALSSNLFFMALRGSFDIKNYWMILFPISQNYFQYAVACVLLLLALPYLVDYLDKINETLFKRGMIVATIALIGLPTLFSNDLWNFGLRGENILWLLYLVILGYTFQRFDIIKKINHPKRHLFFSLAAMIGSVFLMAQVSLAVHNDGSSATRFVVPYSIFAMYYTISLFVNLEKWQNKSQHFFVSGRLLATFLIAIQVVINWRLTTFSVATYYRDAMPHLKMMWVWAICLFTLMYLTAVLVFTIAGYYLQGTRPFIFLEQKLSFSSLAQLKAKAEKLIHWIGGKKRLLYVVGFFYLFTIGQMFLLSGNQIAVSVSNTVNAYFYILFHRQSAILLNVLVIVLFFLLLFYVTNRYWYSFIFTILADLLITISNFLKMSLREEPILPSDMTMISGMNEILNYVNPVIIVAAIIILIAFAYSAIRLERRAKKMYRIKFGWKNKLIKIGLILLFFGSLGFVNHKDSPSYLLFNFFRINRYFYNQKLGAQINGPILQFLNNVDTTVMDEPEGYSKEKIEEIMAKYNGEANQINQERQNWANNQTVIFNLSESFSDPARVPNIEVDGNPIKYILNMKKKTTSGLMLSNGYGGGTANMEWASLTSLDISNLSPTLPTPYTQLVEKQKSAPNITNLFDESVAIHPYVATLYNRIGVYQKFGFDKFYYEGATENKLKFMETIDNSPYVSDESAYKDTLEVLNGNLSTSQFIQLSTMQNHMPYEQDYYEANDYSFIGPAVIDSRKNELNTYMQGIHYTDEAVKGFIKAIDQIQKPITFVFYGDHLPSLYSGNNMATYGLEQHETDFFIYNNKYSREQNKKLANKIVSPYNFSALALEQAGIKVTPYYALITELTNQVLPSTTDPAASVSNNYNGEKVFITKNNKILAEKDLSKKQRDILRDYTLIEYDLTAGNQYSAAWAEQKVNQ
ncbi:MULTISPECIES: LTA synthase family protein [Enterococcus]|uniref:LTA synthase family protein n=1 Tax=Enterococcus alishanensis TaxID=1303817 RepID=A0ABS6TAE8_9ENTE|nr:LTA synthase family protein [Enterococcus alishanensis]MBV7389877.1 LTA synthase family protein [Enterococcus alishanensis]